MECRFCLLVQTGGWKLDFVKKIFVRAMSSMQRHLNEWPIIEYHGQVDSIQTSLN